MVLTLCDNCLQPFLDDPNYRVRFLRNCTPLCDREKGDCDCFICSRHGHDYDVEKISNINK